MALLMISGGSVLLAGAVNAGVAYQERIAPTLTAQVPVTAAVIYVNPATGADAGSAGASAAAPYKTITFALSKAQPGTLIQVAPGNYSKESGEPSHFC